jgi:hypothetical protein
MTAVHVLRSKTTRLVDSNFYQFPFFVFAAHVPVASPALTFGFIFVEANLGEVYVESLAHNGTVAL